MSEATQRFPQTRNGVTCVGHGPGVVTGSYDGQRVFVKFDKYDRPILVPKDELQSLPSRGESPDPATSRFSGYMGNSYRRKK